MTTYYVVYCSSCHTPTWGDENGKMVRSPFLFSTVEEAMTAQDRTTARNEGVHTSLRKMMMTHVNDTVHLTQM